MIDYFKYTNGGSFTLSGSSYIGLFNVLSGVAYSGKSHTSSSSVLSSTDTFLSNCFLRRFEFDRTTTPVDKSIIRQPSVSPRQVIDQTFINTNLGRLNLNNLHLYALNITSNTNILDFVNTTKNGDSYFLGLSSSEKDLRNDDTSLAKDNLYPIQIDPFSFIAEDKVPGVNVLDDTTDSTLFVYDNESYFYFTTTPTTSYTFSGSFVKNGGLVRIGEGAFEGNTKFTYDNNTDVLYSLVGKGSQEGFQLKLYDNSFINPCRVFKLVDQISLPEMIIDEKVEIGNDLIGYRYQTVHVESGRGVRRTYIKILNKYSLNPIDVIQLQDSEEEILAFDIRDTDDSILVLTSYIESPDYTFNVYQIDVDELGLSADGYTLSNPKQINRYKPSYEFNAPRKAGQFNIFFSGNDSNIFTLNDQGAISTRFISNPQEVAGFPSPGNLLYLRDMYFGSTQERFDKIQKKFNSNLLESNFFNNINLIVTKNNKNVFYLLHNIGRIYLFKDTKLVYNNFVPLDLPNLYEKITSCESSLGISINSEIQNIIKDTVNIYLNASTIPIKELYEGIPVLRKYVSYEGIDVNFRNFEFHENEEVNYDTVSRVFNELYQLQVAIINIITAGEGVEEGDDISMVPGTAY